MEGSNTSYKAKGEGVEEDNFDIRPTAGCVDPGFIERGLFKSGIGTSYVAERFLRSHAGAVPGFQSGICEILEGKNWPDGHGGTVAWRLQQAGTRGHRRIAG